MGSSPTAPTSVVLAKDEPLGKGVRLRTPHLSLAAVPDSATACTSGVASFRVSKGLRPATDEVPEEFSSLLGGFTGVGNDVSRARCAAAGLASPVEGVYVLVALRVNREKMRPKLGCKQLAENAGSALARTSADMTMATRTSETMRLMETPPSWRSGTSVPPDWIRGAS